MSTFAYGGISLETVRTLGYQRRVRMDGFAYLWTEHVVSVRGVYNPQATTYSIQGDPNTPVRFLGGNPASTDKVIRHKLVQPRQKLLFTGGIPGTQGGPPLSIFTDGFGDQSGSLVIIDAPPSVNELAPNVDGNPASLVYLTDCNNGPVVLSHDVERIDGTKTWMVTLTLLVCINECFKFYSSPAVVLSHKWRAVADVDRDGFATRTVRGHVIFRSDAMLKARLKPDDLREALGHPVAKNMQRSGIHVDADEEGLRFDYSFTDTETSHRIFAKNVTRMEAFVRIKQTLPGQEDQIDALLFPFVGGARNWFNLLDAARGGMPTVNFVFVVRAWGNRFCPRKDLLAACRKLITIKMPQILAGPAQVGEGVDTMFDLLGRYVEYRVAYSMPPFTTQINTTADEFWAQVPELLDDEVGTLATGLDSDGRSPVPGRLTRGTWLGALVTQALGSPCKLPGPPPPYADATDQSVPVPG